MNCKIAEYLKNNQIYVQRYFDKRACQICRVASRYCVGLRIVTASYLETEAK